MKKFGFHKKGDGDEDSNRSALFGSRSKDKSPKPSTNPYAQPPAASDPYNNAKLKAGVGGTPGGPSPTNNRYGGSPIQNNNGNGSGYGDSKSKSGADPGGARGGGYGSDRYGAQNGYGADRYGAGSGGEQGGSRYGAGGYGGLGNATAADGNRDALFEGAEERLQRNPRGADALGQPPPYAADYGQPGPQSGAYGGGTNSSYEAYGDRQLTAEEEEEEDVEAAKQEIRFMKQEDVSSTRNALRVAAQAEETGRNTLARLGAQGERIHNTEKNLDLTANSNRTAAEKARELKTLNKSMFAVHISNPLTSASRRQQRDDDIMEKHQTERAMREATRREGYETDQRLQKTFKDLNNHNDNSAAARKKSSLAERAKYQFEADSEDEKMEDEIDSNIEALHGAATRLNGLARATATELDEQNRHLTRINDKVSHYAIVVLAPRFLKWQIDSNVKY